MTKQNRRIILAGLLSTIVVVAFAALGGVGFANGSVSSAQYQYGKSKVTICHKGKNTITVSQSARPGHRAADLVFKSMVGGGVSSSTRPPRSTATVVESLTDRQATRPTMATAVTSRRSPNRHL